MLINVYVLESFGLALHEEFGDQLGEDRAIFADCHIFHWLPLALDNLVSAVVDVQTPRVHPTNKVHVGHAEVMEEVVLLPECQDGAELWYT